MSTRGTTREQSGRERSERVATSASGGLNANAVSTDRESAQRATGQAGNQDAHGQHMPFTTADVRTAIQSDAGERLRGTNSARAVTLNGQQYVVKSVSGHEENAPSVVAAHEVAAHDIATIAGMGDLVPAQSFHVVDDGEHISVQSREPGQSLFKLSDREEGQFRSAMQGDPRAALLEYVLGPGDRHGENRLFDAATGKTTLVDFGAVFKLGTALDHSTEIMRAATDKGRISSERIALPHASLRAFSANAPRIEAAMAKYNLPQAEREGVRARLQVLSRLSQMSNPTLADLEDMAGLAK